MKESTLTIPFFVFDYLFNQQINLSIPLIDKEAIFVNVPAADIKKLFQEFVSKDLLKTGEIEKIIPYFKKNKFTPATLEYKIKASTDGISYPEITLPIEYFEYEDKNGIWATIPHLAIEAFAKNTAELHENLKETIDFLLESFHESQLVQELLPLVWNTHPKLKRYTVKIPQHASLHDQEQSKEDSQFLKKIGHQVVLKEKMAFGNDQLILQIMQSYATSIHKNILITGPSQSGKTALIWELIYNFQKLNPELVFIETTASSLIRELSQDDDWKVNIKILIEEVQRKGCILYIRNWMEMFEVGKYIGNDISLGEYLYRYIESEKIQIISECTDSQFSKIEIIKPNYQQFFQVIKNPPLRGKLLEEVVFLKVKAIAQKKGIAVKEDAISEILRLNKRFSPYAGMPGKAIRFMERIIHNRVLAQSGNGKWITKKHIIEAFSEETGIPLLITDPDISFDSNIVESHFKKQLFGQNEAITSIVDMLAVVKSAMTNLNKPIASFIFAGPTGVGKTELAKILAGFIFSDRHRIVRFDMSEYSSFQSIVKLLGTEHKTGHLASAIRKNPFCILLFDEIEKAHQKFNEILLQILEEGRLTDGTGVEISFCSTIIIMTSNIGISKINQTPVGFGTLSENKNFKISLLREIRKYFAPEVFNRIDHSIIFYPISEDITELIVRRELEQLKNREGLKYRKTSIHITDKAIHLLAQKGFDPAYGARNIQRTIRREIAIPLSKQLNQFDQEDHLIIQIDEVGQQINITTQDDELSVELLIEEMQIADLTTEATTLRLDMDKVLNSYLFNQIKGREEYLLKKSIENHKKGKELLKSLELTQKVQSLFDKTENVEKELSLAFLKQGPFRPSAEQELATFRTQLSKVQLQLLSTTYPEKNQHYLYFFGKRLPEIIPYYISTLKEIGLNTTTKTIWHFPKQQLNFYQEKSKINPNWQIKNNTYLQISGWKDKEMLQSATLCGVTLEIKGAGAGYYLKEENNVQEWIFPEGLTEKIIVQSAMTEESTIPSKIHKLEFYKQKPPNLYITKFSNKEPQVKLRSKTQSTLFLDFFKNKWQNAIENDILYEFG